jgi:hypothetical protein
VARSQQTHAKREREIALKERRERKRAKKAERAAGGDLSAADNGSNTTEADGQTEPASTDWIQ